MAYIYEVQYKGEDTREPRDDWEVLAALQRSFEDGMAALEALHEGGSIKTPFAVYYAEAKE